MVMIKMNDGVLYFCMKVKKVSSFRMFSKCVLCYGKLFFFEFGFVYEACRVGSASCLEICPICWV